MIKYELNDYNDFKLYCAKEVVCYMYNTLHVDADLGKKED